jgi:cytosine/adenosine deaminase-related metal-dependent hydrolase
MEIPVHLIKVEDGDVVVEVGVFDTASLTFEEREVEAEKALLQSFFNSHVHLADSVAMEPPQMPLDRLVGPGGYKFSVLQRAKKEEIVEASRNSIVQAASAGTTSFCDFREGGVDGLKLLKEADQYGRVVALGRPGSIEEAEKILQIADGFGMSSVRDHDFSFLEELRTLARKRKKIFAIHAGERDNQDVEKALALEPDILIHMNQASSENLKRAMEEMIPIVSCMRSNYLFGLENRSNYERLAEYEVWALGTDNVMLANPSILSELNFSAYIVNSHSVLRAAFKGFEIFKRKNAWLLMDLKEFRNSRDIISTIVRRTTERNIVGVFDSLNL